MLLGKSGRELLMSKLDLEKAEEPEIKLPNMLGHRESKGIPERKIYLCFINYPKAFDCVDHNNLWKALKEIGIPDHLTCLLLNLYAGQEAIVRTLYGMTGWLKIEKGILQGSLLSPCLFNPYSEHIMRTARLDGLQGGIKIGRRNINNLRYADDTILMTESEEELKSLLMRVKEESERASLKLNIKKKTKIMASSPITAWQIEGAKLEVVTDFLFLDSKITEGGGCKPRNQKTSASW